MFLMPEAIKNHSWLYNINYFFFGILVEETVAGTQSKWLKAGTFEPFSIVLCQMKGSIHFEVNLKKRGDFAYLPPLCKYFFQKLVSFTFILVVHHCFSTKLKFFSIIMQCSLFQDSYSYLFSAKFWVGKSSPPPHKFSKRWGGGQPHITFPSKCVKV